jgi:hypothetical protein
MAVTRTQMEMLDYGSSLYKKWEEDGNGVGESF